MRWFLMGLAFFRDFPARRARQGYTSAVIVMFWPHPGPHGEPSRQEMEARFNAWLYWEGQYEKYYYPRSADELKQAVSRCENMHAESWHHRKVGSVIDHRYAKRARENFREGVS